MRSWIFGAKEDKKKDDNTDDDGAITSSVRSVDGLVPQDTGQNQNVTAPQSRGFVSSSLAAAGDGIGFFSSIRGRVGTQDAELERKVSLAARNLGDGVQSIVMAAKGRQQSGANVEWKSQLLQLLGGSDDEQKESDIDVLLDSRKSDKFVLRCLENELPPNMIHCLRLLRVLELQHATAVTQAAAKDNGDHSVVVTPISSQATSKVSKLLCSLCTDPTVGEQLRPHLFGLLALSGASYPASGVHVAKAASEVIIAFSENCLSTSLVWFLHDRKMIIHMTDDIKELCGMSKKDSTPNPGATTSTPGLYGSKAEEQGLWSVALSTVIHLVVNSCNYDCLELLNDFTAAGGNDVLQEAIMNSKSKHGKALMELVPLLASCLTKEPDGAAVKPKEKENLKQASNPAALDIMESIMTSSVPLLHEYLKQHSKKPEIIDETSIRDLATFSIEISVSVRFADGIDLTSKSEEDFDLPTDLLLAALQLCSDHPSNYAILQQKNQLLTFYLLSFPTFHDENLKALIMKTVEFVVTGMTGADAAEPLAIMGEVFVAVCQSLLKGAPGVDRGTDLEQRFLDGLLSDASLICETLEKLLQFDNRVAPILIQGGALSAKLADIVTLLLESTAEQTWGEKFEDDGKTFTEPPSSTSLDNVCAAVCRVLALLLAHQSRKSISLLHHSMSDFFNNSNDNDTTETRTESFDVNTLLLTAVKELGDNAAVAASGVFESIMSSREHLDSLLTDMSFCLKICDYFSEMIARMCGVPVFSKNKFIAPKRKKGSKLSELQMMEDFKFNPKRIVSDQTIRRVNGLFIMMKNVLETSSLARDAFRICGGFEAIIRVLLSMGGLGAQQKVSSDGDVGYFVNVQLLMEFLQTLFSVIDASMGQNCKDTQDEDETDTSLNLVSLPTNAIVDPVSSQHDALSPALQNTYYLRVKGFYIDFGVAIARTKILTNIDSARIVINLAMSHMDPSFNLSKMGEGQKSLKVQLLRNPDACRLVLTIATFLPNDESGQTLAKSSFDQIIRLCDPSRLGSTLSQIASCGLCWSITNPKEFAALLDDPSHPLHTRFILLMRRIAAFSMSYNDFVSILRCVAGPVLKNGDNDTRIRLPVLSSSVRGRVTTQAGDKNTEGWAERDADLCRRLESLCTIAERGDRVPRCVVGGDSINTLSVLLHKTKVEDRLYKASEDGRLNFVEIESIDSSALKPGGFLSAGTAAPGSSGGERIWTPLASTGCSFSVWLRYPNPRDDFKEGNLYILDISSPSLGGNAGAQNAVFLSVWYDLQNQRFNVLSSASYRGEPTCFPVSPLSPDVWHHVLITYTPTKRTMMGRKSVFGIYVDGRPLEAEVRVESVNLPPNSKVIIGAPNPAVAVSGVVRGMLPVWDLGPTLMLSTVLMDLDATAIFTFGPDFQGMFWGDRPQRLSLSATGTAAFAMLAEIGEPGSVASALRRREIARLEAAGTVSREMGLGGPSDADNDSLASLGLLCSIPPECVVFAYRAASKVFKSHRLNSGGSNNIGKWKHYDDLVNMARLNNNNDVVSTDAVVYGKAGVVAPRCFADNVQWAGGPEVLMPIVNASSSSNCLALALRLMRASTRRHPPNLESMQAGGGYQMLAALLEGKKLVDETVLNQCFAFAVHGFVPITSNDGNTSGARHNQPHQPSPRGSDMWVFSDLDAMKQLLLNHQVWDLRNSGPDLSLQLLSFMNGLVGQKSIHKAFNSRRLHLVGIVRWTLHLMIEAAELYTAGENAMRNQQIRRRAMSEDSIDKVTPTSVNSAALNHGWYSEAPSVYVVSVGGDPDNPLLQASKTLLRRVLTFMLTPGDLDAISESTMYTLCIGGSSMKANANKKKQSPETPVSTENEKLLPGPVTRIYLLRLIEELIVDGVNEIVASAIEKRADGDPVKTDAAVQPHAGGIANPNQTYLAAAILGGRNRNGEVHPKHQQAQNFLTAFANVLTPVWFAALLEGCHEEATASAVLRLMILMLQCSSSFAAAFYAAGGFAPLVLSIPKFSTCSNITISLLSQLLHVSILHLPCFPTLDSAQLNEVFDTEAELSELIAEASNQSVRKIDPSCGIFALLAECIGRNIQLEPFDNDLGQKAKQSNKAVLELLAHRHSLSPAFREFCRSPDFLEPLSQTLCLVYDERLQRLQLVNKVPQEETQQGEKRRSKRRSILSEVPLDVSATERFVGDTKGETSGTGVGMVNLLRMVVSHAAMSGPIAPPLVHSLFHSYSIHATIEQVEAFHLVLVELCKTVVEEASELGEPIALASSVGICSVLLERLMLGSFTAEPALQSVATSMTLLSCLTAPDSKASRSLGATELAMISADAAHIARLTCLCALRRSRSLSDDDEGDPDLQQAILEHIAANMNSLLIVPKGVGNTRKVLNPGVHPPPPTNSKAYPLWQSASLMRCIQPNVDLLYPDLCDTDEPLKLFVVGIMVEIQILLRDPRDDTRQSAIAIVVALLQQRRNIMAGILIKEIQQGDRMEIIDVMNRGGFGALLVAHEAASSAGGSSDKKKYKTFFDWYEKNQSQVQLVFDGIQAETKKLFPGLGMGATSPEVAMYEQQEMLRRLLPQDDRTLVGGYERSELSQRCIGRTGESHGHWKRQGFDDLAAGAMQWKFLLRRLKGSCSIWEGGRRYAGRNIMLRHQTLYANMAGLQIRDEVRDEKTGEVVTRWKLDLTEGSERQRRRLLPNYEFHSLYNVDEKADQEAKDEEEEEEEELQSPHAGQEDTEDASSKRHSVNARQSEYFSTEMEFTAELLKEMNIKTVHRNEDDEDDEEENEDETQTVATTATGGSLNETQSNAGESAADFKEDDNVEEVEEADDHHDAENASSYELITGLLQAGDWPEHSYNVRRCTGLEVRKALLLWCRDAIYVIDGFEQTDGEGLEGKITRVEKEQSSYNINLRPKDFKASEESDDVSVSGVQDDGAKVTETSRSGKSNSQDSTNEVAYQHRSQRISFADLHSVFRRRYQLQQIALEFYDTHRNGTLIAFANHAEREEVLSKVLYSPLPNSIFSSSYGTSINYRKFMSSLKTKIISQWVNGKMTNFEFLMHLNSFAGRTYNDLTQYPVFPWVLADYDSEEIDLSDPSVYRDLSKPMGALGEERAQQFRDRYEALEANYYNDDEPPPFHYGTHYSCAAYVLYYLMRLEPFSRLALSLQGGRFDVADRLFHNIGSSWKSASEENLQDVRELIPEFFYLPDFLTNTNNFDFGTTQKGKAVHDVSLPKWAHGDPKRFIRINRQALESEYVSKHLHLWIDLVFGWKQRGQEAVNALNTFVHVTYEGEVDLDAMTDPVQRESTIAQIQNFGQTPSRLEKKPFPQRTAAQALKDKNIDFGALSYLAPLTPPFCIVGAVHRCQVKRTLTDICKVGLSSSSDKDVGDMCLVKGQILGVGRMCALIIPAKRYYKFGGPHNGLSVHVASTSARHRELNKMLSIHDGLHRAAISVVKPSLDGKWLVTGCIDSTVRVWKYNGDTVQLRTTFCGHGGWKITSVDISTDFGTIVTGCARGTVLLWDLRTLTFVRRLRHTFKDEADGTVGIVHEASSVSMNHKNGNVVTLIGSHLSVFDINGNLLGTENSLGAMPTCAVATDCPEWMDQGIVAVTGHVNGEVRFWRLDYDTAELMVKYLMVDKEHTCKITALRVTGEIRQDTLLVGDSSGKMSVFKTAQLENMSQKELMEVTTELKTGLMKADQPSEKTSADFGTSIRNFLPGGSRESGGGGSGGGGGSD